MDRQQHAIKSECQQRQLDLIAIYEDIASTMKEGVLSRLPGLQDAIKAAKSHDAPIVVTNRNRIARAKGEVERISAAHDVQLICIDDWSQAVPTMVPDSGRGQRFGERVSQGTTAGLKKRKANNVRLGNTNNLPVAQRKGAIANALRFDETMRRIAKVLQSEDPGMEWTAKQVVERLNGCGIKTGWGRPWTVDGVRRPLRAARHQLRMEAEIDDE